MYQNQRELGKLRIDRSEELKTQLTHVCLYILLNQGVHIGYSLRVLVLALAYLAL